MQLYSDNNNQEDFCEKWNQWLWRLIGLQNRQSFVPAQINLHLIAWMLQLN